MGCAWGVRGYYCRVHGLACLVVAVLHILMNDGCGIDNIDVGIFCAFENMYEEKLARSADPCVYSTFAWQF